MMKARKLTNLSFHETYELIKIGKGRYKTMF